MTAPEGNASADEPIWSWFTPPAAHHRRYAGTGVWRDRTVGDLARHWAEREPDAPVFLEEAVPPTYASLCVDAEALARSLLELGLKQGDVASFITPNWYEAGVINLACAMTGIVINPIITIYRDAEVRQMLGDCRAKILFSCESFRGYDFAAMVDRIRPDLPDLRHVAWVRGSREGMRYETLVEAGRGSTRPLGRIDPDSVKMLLYTSGTTGRPKGVLHSHNSLERAVVPLAVTRWGYVEGAVMLMPSPVTHVSGYTNGLEMPFLAGTRTVLMEHWNVQVALELIERHQVSLMLAATPFLQELTAAAKAAGTRLPSLRFFGCGGAAVPPEVVREANLQFEHPCALRIYGSSEVPLITLGYLPSEDRELAATTDGIIVDYEVRLVDDDMNDVPPGGDGEIIARGPAMFMGYANEEHTRGSITDDGYFLTGDIGRMTPEGALVITGRKKDLIIRGGENISAKEIEDVLHQHPDIVEASVVAMPHERLGEGICAYVVTRPGAQLDIQAISAAVAASGLANQKRPERVEFVEALPKTASGKVRKDVLRQQIKDMLVSSNDGAPRG